MAHSVPRDGIDNLGDYVRWQMACRAFIVFMMEKDPRVLAGWDAWLGARQIPAWARRRWTEAPVSDETANGLLTAILHVSDPEDLQWFQRLVHDELGIPYVWVPQMLRNAFQASTAKKLALPVRGRQASARPDLRRRTTPSSPAPSSATVLASGTESGV